MNFEKWLKQIGKSDRTANSYSKAISGSISDWANSSGLIAENLSTISSRNEFDALSIKIKNLEVFQEKNTKGNGMYSAALNHYATYLHDITNEEILEDIEAVIASSDIDKTEKSALVNARVGQGKYRSNLIEYWGGCALTGFGDIRFLIASHIKPWRKSDNQERLDPFNGLLLLPNLDKVFDLGFVTFSREGLIMISAYLEDASKLGVIKDMRLSLDDGHLEYMEYHRDVVYECNV